jgi:hypothetical protein
MEILSFRKSTSESAKVGSFSLLLPEWRNFIIHDMAYFVKDNRHWVTFPQKQYEKDGQKKYFTLNTFQDFNEAKIFLHDVLELLKDYLKQQGEQAFETQEHKSQENLPF